MGRKRKIGRINLYMRLLSEIRSIKTVEQLDIVGGMISDYYESADLTRKQYQKLRSALSKQAGVVGEKKAIVRLGGLTIGAEKKGKFF